MSLRTKTAVHTHGLVRNKCRASHWPRLGKATISHNGRLCLSQSPDAFTQVRHRKVSAAPAGRRRYPDGLGKPSREISVLMAVSVPTLCCGTVLPARSCPAHRTIQPLPPPPNRTFLARTQGGNGARRLRDTRCRDHTSADRRRRAVASKATREVAQARSWPLTRWGTCRGRTATPLRLYAHPTSARFGRRSSARVARCSGAAKGIAGTLGRRSGASRRHSSRGTLKLSRPSDFPPISRNHHCTCVRSRGRRRPSAVPTISCRTTHAFNPEGAHTLFRILGIRWTPCRGWALSGEHRCIPHTFRR